MKTGKTDQVRPIRDMKSLLLEDLGLTTAAYATLASFSLGFISYAWMQVIMVLYVVRVFNLRHERAHLPLSMKNRWLFAVSNLLEVYHSPLQEPFEEKRKKHLWHHQAHVGKREIPLLSNPHAALEQGFFSALLSAAFYHELMLFLDLVRERRLSRIRLTMLVVSSAAIALTIGIVGLESFLLFVLAYRVASFIAWFSFSYVLHIDELYENELGPKLPPFFKRATEWILGSGSVTAIFYHQFHHRRPNSFHRF